MKDVLVDGKNSEWPKHPEIFDKCMELAKTSQNRVQWIHLADAVEIGSITPMEAYDTIKLGYLAEGLTIRDSRYKHLL